MPYIQQHKIPGHHMLQQYEEGDFVLGSESHWNLNKKKKKKKEDLK